MPPPAVASEAPARRGRPPRVVRTVRDAVYRATVIAAGLTARDLVAVAVSGGPDSMVLLDALQAARERGGPALHVLHFDHAWHEGSAAVADDVSAACRAQGLPMTSERATQPARQKGESPEMAARRLRLHFLRREGARLGAVRVATGHQADDQVETVLMNLARGGGPDALRGMQQDDGWTLRPLLTVWRGQVEAYSAVRCLAIHRDPSNEARVFRRNRVRHELVPLLNDIYPGGRKALLRASALASPGPQPMVRSVLGVRMPLACDRRAVAAGPLRQVLTAALRSDGRPTRQLGASVWRMLACALADNTAGRWIQLPGRRWAYVRNRAIALYSHRANDQPLAKSVPLSVPTDVDLAVGRIKVRRVVAEAARRAEPDVQVLGIQPPNAVLAVRSPRRGDRMTSPVDGRAHDLGRLLSRRRVPAALRDGTPVITVNDQPVCVPEVTVDARYLPASDAAHVLTVETQWTPLPASSLPGGFVTESGTVAPTLDA